MAQRVELEAEREAEPGTPGVALADRQGVSPSLHRSSRAKWLVLFLVVAVAAVTIGLWRHYSGWESTDDAQIEGHIDPISARVGGHVISVKVPENEYVDAGTVLVELDPRDYQV